MNPRSEASSPYMQWAKGHVHVDFNLATSGVANAPLTMLPFSANELEITGNSYYGYAPLMQALSKHCGVPAANIFSTLGTSLANHLAMAALVSPGDDVLIESPTYELLLSTAAYLGVNVRRFPRRREHGYAIDSDDVRRAMTERTRLVVITNLHNPSSARCSDEIIVRLAGIARSSGARLLVDEVYLDADFSNPHATSALLAPDIVVTNSLTKVYGLSGLRCGWVLGDPELIRKLWHLNDLFEVIPPHIPERLSLIALERISSFASRAQEILTANHASFKELIAGRSEIEVTYSGIGTVVFPRLLKGSAQELERRCLESYKTAIAPGTFFDAPDCFRIGLGGEPSMTRKGLEHLAECLGTL